MISKEMVVKAIIEKVENESDDAQIKTPLLAGYDKPDRIGFKGKSGEGYVPDIVLSRHDRTEFYCVELDEDLPVNKWRLFSLYTMKENGSLNIVAPEDNLSHVREVLNENNINARILYFS
ncbi:MAG: hypothetical protein P1P86_11695 [Bacteroidales bacterium]|nr:hypothetical protein [Bacteroidales bacterium]